MKKKTHNFEKVSSSSIDNFLTTPMCIHQKNNWWRDLLNHLEFCNMTKRMSAGNSPTTRQTTPVSLDE